MTPELGLILAAFLVGLLVGLTSIGGAALMTPFLILVVGVRPVMAVGTDLVYGAITRLAGAAMHWRQRTVNLPTALHLAYGSVPAGMLGVLMVGQLHRFGINPDRYMQHAIGAVLVVVSLLMLARTFYSREMEAPAILKKHQRAATIAWGAVVGLAVGLTSVGSGSLVAPFLIMLFPAAPAQVVGTDVFHATLLVTATAFLYGQAGHVDWHLVPILLGGALPGVVLGSWLAPQLPARALRVGLSVVLFGTGVKLV